MTLTAQASGFPTPTVQWQVLAPGGKAFADIPGATSSSLTVTASSASNGSQYRAVFANGVGGKVTSQAAALRVGVPPSVTLSPVDQTRNAGQTVRFTASASASPTPTVQWHGGLTFHNIAGATATSLSFTVSAKQDGDLFRAVFTNPIGAVISSAATLVVW